MGFETGNQWWRERSRHGVEAIFTDPAKLWEAATEYFEATDNRPWNEDDWVGKDAVGVTRKHATPYTLSGLCVFLGVNTQYFGSFKDSVTFKSNPDFNIVYTRIKEVIETHQVEGAMTGFFNASLTARLNGLSDKQDMTLNATVTQLSNEPKTRKECEDMLRKLTE